MTNTQRRIYLDHAATTPGGCARAGSDAAVLGRALWQYVLHLIRSDARRSRRWTRRARRWPRCWAAPRQRSCSRAAGRRAIIWRSGVRCWRRDRPNAASILITTPIEHHAVGATVEQLHELSGCEVTLVEVDQYGMVDPDAIGRAIRSDTVLISVMYANNEVGTVQPIAEIGKIARAKGIAFHTDAVQAGGQLNLNVDRLNVDLLALVGAQILRAKGRGGVVRPIGHGVDLGVDGRRTRARSAAGHGERGGDRRAGDRFEVGAGTA